MLRRYSGSFSVSLKRSETCFLVLYMGSWSSGCGSLPFLSAITSHPGYGHVSLIQAHTSLTLPGERNPHCSCLVQIVTVLIHLALLAGYSNHLSYYFSQATSCFQYSTTPILSACRPLGFLRVFCLYIPFLICEHICT